MKYRLILINTALVTLALALMSVLGILVTRSERYETAEARVIDVVEIYAANYRADGFATVDDGVRITVIDADGNVISDSNRSDVSGLENHLGREEIVAALNGTPAICIRKSDTFGVDMLYYAEKVDIGESYVFIRAAVTVESINSYVRKTVPTALLILAATVTLSLIATLIFSGNVLKPLKKVEAALSGIEQGVYEKILPAERDDEINQILVRIGEIGERLEKSIQSSEDGKEKLNYILNNISDGLIVLDEQLKVTTANRRLESIFGVKRCEGKDFRVLTGDRNFLSAAEDCAAHKRNSIFQMEINGEWYLCTVSYTENRLIIIVLTDITASKNNEKMRLEFFANASHELKTPLTAIKGFDEMILLSDDRDKIRLYAEKIGKETSRMVALIDDMLNLSRLENLTSVNGALTDTDIAETCKEAAESLKVLSEKKGIAVTVSGSGTVRAEREHIYELVKNLMENSIRYNNEGGSVDVSVRSEDGRTILTVSDNGIGIDREHQSRIFERFYRVDKSRSRATGGTGLGLAIVKHICELYNAEISLTSELGAGTCVKVVFFS